MKKIIFMIAMLLSSVTTFAQHETGSLTIQPKVGLNIANFTNSEGADPRFVMAAGAEFEYQASGLISISAGLLYSMQGAKADVTIEGTKAKGTVKMDYINIPILANVYVAKNFAVKVGLQPGFNTTDKIKVTANGMSAEMDLSKVGLESKSFDLSLPVGISYEFNNIVIDGRYNLGLTEVVEDTDSKNSVFQFTVGYKFKL